MPKLIHYRQKCIGCNICFEMWPLRWRLSRVDGKCTLVGGVLKAKVYVASIPESERAINARIASACPVNIIKLDG
ncbi:MAG TPA: ferredoxin [Bacteroidia bacterium]|nr:ferredoxin [Bacteroidia bacterium]